MNRREFLKTAAALAAGAECLGGAVCRHAAAAASPAANPQAETAARKPNFVVIFIDDMGYGDIEPFGSKINRTPNLNRMAAEGMRLTSFYVAAAVCTPSRAALMTGCYPKRVGLAMGSWHGVLMPGDSHGLHPEEITVAELLRSAGYATGCFGKWHLGDQPEFLPTRHGFDTYFGIPYSNDMWAGDTRSFPPLPLLRGEKVVGQVGTEQEQMELCRLITEEAVKFIRANRDRPFFAYIPHSFIHHPRLPRKKFLDSALNSDKASGGVIEETDWSVGEILAAIRELGIAENTLVLFTSDNGGPRGSVNAPLRGGKGSQFEGGMREPTLAWWPGTVLAGSVCDELLTSMDVLPTFAALAGAKVPDDRVIDGRDILPLLKGRPGAKTPHEMFFYYRQNALTAVRAGKWKLFVKGELYDLETDIGESRNVAGQNPEVVARLSELLARAREDLGDGGRPGKNCRPVGVSANPRTLLPRAGVSGDAAYAPYRGEGTTPLKKDAKAGKLK
ncbi:MAG: sulfatase [Planctomycetes bacterium]|nr:sulfatase [Planctomycetota bacterium]